MPTFSEIENQKQGGLPILLVSITHAGQTYRYCNAEYPVTAEGEVYAPVPLQISEIRTTAMLQSDDSTITLPRTVEVFGFLFPTMTKRPISVEVRQTHEGASDAPMIFSGRAVSAGMTEDRTGITITAKDLFFQNEKSNSRRKFQLGCPLLLYGHQCRANFGSSMVYTTGQVIAGALYVNMVDQGTSGTTFRGRNLSDPVQRQFLVGSYLIINEKRYDTEKAPTPSATGTMPRRFRFYVSASDMAEISAFYASVPEADRRAIVIPDCERTIRCCDEIHRNNLNFGGQPDLPYENPVGKINL